MKKTLISILFITFSLMLSGFEWPQDNVTSDSYKSYFGQNRGGKISSSLVFLESSIVKAAENGETIIIMSEEKDDTDFFPSALGTAVILTHKDDLLSVYGNLSEELLSKNITTTDTNSVFSGDLIGESGNTGWQDNVSGLEFQIIDIKNSSAINPKVLMSRIDNETVLTLAGISVENKTGEKYDLNTTRTFSTGLYKIYQKRNPIAIPYKSTVLINGVIVDQLSYDMIIQENGKTCVVGKKKYTGTDIYPDSERHLIGEAMFTSGRTTLTLIVTDINGNNKQATYNLIIH